MDGALNSRLPVPLDRPAPACQTGRGADLFPHEVKDRSIEQPMERQRRPGAHRQVALDADRAEPAAQGHPGRANVGKLRINGPFRIREWIGFVSAYRSCPWVNTTRSDSTVRPTGCDAWLPEP